MKKSIALMIVSSAFFHLVGCSLDSVVDADPTVADLCPHDPNKIEAGICGCGMSDRDTDGDNTADCIDDCVHDPDKTKAGICGCGMSDRDTDGDNTADCVDDCVHDPDKTEAGICGCGTSDGDTDGDNTADCIDDCVHDPDKIEPGLCGCGVPETSSACSSTPPNFILILTDDQMLSEIGYTGGDVHTPTIDRLAKEGLTFANAYVTSTVCAPARYTYLTGRYTGRNTSNAFLNKFPIGDLTRIENVNTELEANGYNLPNMLKTRGYTTGVVGKWHLGFHPDTSAENLDFESYAQSADPKNNQKVNHAMEANHKKLCNAIKTFGWDYAGSIYKANLKELHNDALNVHNIDWTVRGALDFLDQTGDQPFFLFFSTTLNHGPHPRNLVDGKMRNGVDADPRYTGEGYVTPALNVLPSRKNIKNRVATAGKEYRTAFATWLDDAIASLEKKLIERGKLKNTIIIYASDHGYERYGKSSLFYGGVHVPMFVSWKGTIKPGSQTDELVQNIDVAATLYDYAGVDLPLDYGLDGKSLRPLIEGSLDAEIHESLFFEIGYARAVMTKQHKYVAVRYPPDVQAKIDRGEKFDGWKGEKLDYPYLLKNSHLGYYAATHNPFYFHLDQLYDLKNDLVDESNNLLYNQNGKPILEKNLSLSVKSKRDEMRTKLIEYLQTFSGRPFGEFYDGK